MLKKIYNDFDDNYRESLINRIKVNKKGELTYTDILQNYNLNYINNKADISKDILYEEKKNKYHKLSFNRNNIPILGKEITNNTMKLSKHDTFKKTINIYSSENQKKQGNIIEDLQNNKYLRPMLDTSNINIKLLKCQIEEPIKNISNFSLKEYINKYGFFSKFSKSPNIENNEDKVNISKINNRSALAIIDPDFNLDDRSSINNKISLLSENNNSNSFIKKKVPQKNNKYILNESPTNLKKYSSIQRGIHNNEKNKKREKIKERNINILNNNNENVNDINLIYDTNYFKDNLTINRKLKNNNKHENFTGNNKFLENKNNLKNEKLLEIYKKKLIEEFIIILNKFISSHLNKNIGFFFKNLIKNKGKEKEKENSKNKVYLKKNNKCIRKKSSLTSKNNEIKNNNLIINYEIEKDIEKIKTKVITTDTSNNNFNLNNKSFSNEIKSSSLSYNYMSNLLSNNNKQSNNSSSFLFIDKKHKNYSQSPEETINKASKNPIKIKTIIYQKRKSESPWRSPSEGKGDNFIYKKKNLKNDNLYVRKNNSKCADKLKNKKKGKIIGIDINLGKPIRIINDHSPLEELYLERNKPYLFQLNEMNTKFNKNKKRKANSGNKKKIKPPLQLKKFADEDDEDNIDFINNFYLDGVKETYSIKRNKEKNIYLENSLKEINSKKYKINTSIMNTNIDNRENIIKEKNLYIRTNTLFYYDYENARNEGKIKNYKVVNNISLVLAREKKAKNIFIKKKVNKLYINCTKFLVKLLIRLIKKRLFNKIYKWNKSFKKK